MSRPIPMAACTVLTLFAALMPAIARAQARPTAVAAGSGSLRELREWDRQIDQMLRSGELRVREVERDTLIAGRRHERLDQYFRGVRIAGGDVTRQTADEGTVSLFGMLHTGLDLDVTPRLSSDEAHDAIRRGSGGQASASDPELVILPLSDGYHLAYYGQAIVGAEILNVYVDANTGALLQQFSAFVSEGVIGRGIGTYGDTKKVSVTPMSGTFVTTDGLRPAVITTYDMKGDLTRTFQILTVQTAAATSDIASDSDNDWTDGNVVDAHVHGGWYYDYLFKRFGRRGVDGNNLRIALFTHPVRLADIGTQPPQVVGMYYVNAFFCAVCGPGGRGAVVLGEGAPRGFLGDLEVKPFSAALDVVAHELTHAVTAATARLSGFPFSEGGALNEAFSDMFGASTAFFFLPAGSAPLQASYLVGKDLTVPAGMFSRSLSNPTQRGGPDHYTRRNITRGPHFNSTIASHAFYLAIEGGTNGTSGSTVQGVGAANREQIEKAFFRALTVLLPSNATFALTRAATMQAARDLYGAGSTADRAVTQAWSAVGVEERTSPTATLLPNPATSTNNLCGNERPSWFLGITASAGASTLRIVQWQVELFDGAGRSLSSNTRSPATFAQFFNQCGPGSDRILAQTDACSAVCVALGGRSTGSAQVSFSAVDEAGRPVSFGTPRATLLPPQ